MWTTTPPFRRGMWLSPTTEQKGIFRGAFFACPLSEAARREARLLRMFFRADALSKHSANLSLLLKNFYKCLRCVSKFSAKTSDAFENCPRRFSRRAEMVRKQGRGIVSAGEYLGETDAMGSDGRAERTRKKETQKSIPRGMPFRLSLNQNAAMMAPLYFSWRKSLTCWLWSVFTSFWISGRFSSPLRTATMFT